jgi:glutamate racemase
MRPIAVFDSGIGGLTVLKSLRDCYPHLDFIYLGDTARLPYGSKNPKTIRLYLEQCLHFLSQFDPEAYVVACNSASTQVQETHWNNRPLINVIDPVVQWTLEESSCQNIGVLGTRATIQSSIFKTKLLQLNPQCVVTEQACPLFVPLAEEGWAQDPLTDLIAFRYLESMRKAQVDTLILGCTHYPILRESIQKAVGSQVQLIQAGPVLAEYLQSQLHLTPLQLTPTNLNSFQLNPRQLNPQKLNPVHLIPVTEESSKQGNLRLLVTDSSHHLSLLARNILTLPENFSLEWISL